MSELLNDIVTSVLNRLSSEYVYRKLGLCYDYPAKENAFPLSTLPKADEICSSTPNTSGKDTGMYNCILNNTLLFDGLAIRFEIGFAPEQDYTIFDRLIGGTIRLATVAPKNTIVRGLSGDGRYFYSESTLDTVLLWVYTALRTTKTPCVATDSQQKLKNITSRWITKFCARDYKLTDESDQINLENKVEAVKLAAILAMCSSITANSDYSKKALEILPSQLDINQDLPVEDLIYIQIALSAISNIFAEEEKITAAINPLINMILLYAVQHIDDWKKFKTTTEEENIDTDWRNFAPASDEPAKSQLAIANEAESLTSSALALYTIFLSSNKTLILEHKDKISEAFKTIPWDKAILASTLVPLAAIHARGVECKLWDEILSEYKISFQAEESLVAEFMTPDYDEKNPDKAGHINAPKKKPVIEAPKEERSNNNSKKKKKRRRRKPKNSSAASDTRKAEEGTKKKSGSTAKAENNTAQEKKEGAKPQGKKPNRKRRNNNRKRQASQKKPQQSE